MELTELPGVGAVTEKKLNDVGIYDIKQILTSSPSDLMDLTGMDAESVRALVKKSRDKLIESNEIPQVFRTAKEIDDNMRDNVEFITTGTTCFDTLLDGGVETQAITEVYGQFGSGKTQFCYTMAVRVQLPKDKGGLEGKCFWLDTEKTFHPSRIKDMAEGLGVDDALENIIVAHAHNSAEQQLILEECERKIKEENIRLIVIDSATGLFRNEYIGRGNLSNRQGKITKFIGLASKIAQNNNVAVIVTNQVMLNPGMLFGDPTIPIGGMALGHTSTYRIYFQKKGKKHYAVMVDSPRHPDMDQMFELTKQGIADPVEKKKK